MNKENFLCKSFCLWSISALSVGLFVSLVYLHQSTCSFFKYFIISRYFVTLGSSCIFYALLSQSAIFLSSKILIPVLQNVIRNQGLGAGMYSFYWNSISSRLSKNKSMKVSVCILTSICSHIQCFYMQPFISMNSHWYLLI